MTNLTAPQPTRQTTTSPRTLAVLSWVGGGSLWLAAGLVHADQGWRFAAASWLWLGADLLVLVGLLLLLVLRPHGTSRVGAAAVVVAVVGRCVFGVGEIVCLVRGDDQTPLIPMAALLTALSMTAYGVVVLRRGAGRRLWSFLLVGLYPVVGMFPVVALTGEPSYVLIGVWGVVMALVAVDLARTTART